MSGDMGVRFTCDSPDQQAADWLSCVLVWYTAQADSGFTTAHLIPRVHPILGASAPLSPAG